MSAGTSSIKPIVLYDHLPGILAGYPAVMFLILGLLSLPHDLYEKHLAENPVAAAAVDSSEAGGEVAGSVAKDPWWVLDPHMLFWIALSIMIVWYLAFRFNMPKSKFILVAGMLGTFVGIPVVLEFTDYIRPFSSVAQALGYFSPEVSAGAFFVLSIVFTIIWIGNMFYSRTHMRVVIDESGLTINRLGGKGERFELIGLKTENEPLDYLELFMAGIGSLSLKTRMNKEIFKMERVVGLYRIPFFPFFRGKLSRIEEILSYQGKVVSVESQDAAEAADDMGAESEESVAAGGDELGDYDDASTGESRDIR